MRIFVSSSLILLLAFSAFGQNHYYVSKSLGNDATFAVNDSTHPMASMARVNSILTSNPIVPTFFHFRGGETWDSTLSVNRSGSAGIRITYTSYDTAGRGMPTIRCWGDTNWKGWANSANWSLYGPAYNGVGYVWRLPYDSATAPANGHSPYGMWIKYAGNTSEAAYCYGISAKAAASTVPWDSINGVQGVMGKGFSDNTSDAVSNRRHGKWWAKVDAFSWPTDTLYLWTPTNDNPATIYTMYWAADKNKSSTTVLLNANDYITFDGLKIEGGITALNGSGADSLIIRNCTIGNLTGNVGVYPRQSRNVWIHHNTIDKCDTINWARGSSGASAGLYNELVNRSVFEYNTVRNWRHDQFSFFRSDSNEVRYNIFSSNDADYGRAYGVDTGSNNNSFHHNLIRNTRSRSQIYGNYNNFYYEYYDTVKNMTVREDGDDANQGIQIGSGSVGYARNNIFSNIIFNSTFSAGLAVQANATGNIFQNLLFINCGQNKNKISWGAYYSPTRQDSNMALWIRNDAGHTRNTYRNIYFWNDRGGTSPSTVIKYYSALNSSANITPTTFEGYNLAASNYDTLSFLRFGNPNVSSAIVPLAGSPLIDSGWAGNPALSFSPDRAGSVVPQNGRVDIGGFEFVPTALFYRIDSFNVANTNNVPGYGGWWRNVSNANNCAIYDSTLTADTTFANSTWSTIAFDSLISGNNEVEVEVKGLPSTISGHVVRIMTRMQNQDLSTGDGHVLIYDVNTSGADALRLRRWSNNAISTFTPDQSTAFSASVGDRIKFRVDQDNKTMRGFINGTELVTYQDSSISWNPAGTNGQRWYWWIQIMNTKAGGGLVKLDNFYVGRIQIPANQNPVIQSFTKTPAGDVDTSQTNVFTFRATDDYELDSMKIYHDGSLVLQVGNIQALDTTISYSLKNNTAANHVYYCRVRDDSGLAVQSIQSAYNSTVTPPPTPSDTSKFIGGYLPYWSIKGVNGGGTDCTMNPDDIYTWIPNVTDVYYFGAGVSSTFTIRNHAMFSTTPNANAYLSVVRDRIHASGKRFLITVGGGGNQYLAQAIQTQAGRDTLIRDMMGVYDRNLLDGFDIDMENTTSGGFGFSSADTTVYKSFINQLRDSLNTRFQTIAPTKRPLLHAATIWQPAMFNGLVVAGKFDRVNIMTYDMVTGGYFVKSWHNNALYSRSDEANGAYVTGAGCGNTSTPLQSVQNRWNSFKNAGADSSSGKWSIGLEMGFAYRWIGGQLTSNPLNGVYRPNQIINVDANCNGLGLTINSSTYRVFRNLWPSLVTPPSNWTLYRDTASGNSPYVQVFTDDGVPSNDEFISYQDSLQAATISAWARARNLGVILYSIGDGFLANRPTVNTGSAHWIDPNPDKLMDAVYLAYGIDTTTPRINSISPTQLYTDNGAFTLTVNGENFKNGSKIKFQDTIKTTTYVNATRLTCTVGAGSLTTAGNKAVTVTNYIGSDSVTSSQSVLTVLAANPAPVITGTRPDSIGQGAQSFVVYIDGSNFSTATVALSGSGYNITSTQTVSPTVIQFRVSVDLDATTGARDLYVTNYDGKADTLASAIYIVAHPTLTSVTAASMTQGNQNLVTLTGTDFQGIESGSFNGPYLRFSGSGVTGTNLSITSSTSATATVTVDAQAATGARDVYFIDGKGGLDTLESGFTVDTLTSGATLNYSMYYYNTITHQGNVGNPPFLTFDSLGAIDNYPAPPVGKFQITPYGIMKHDRSILGAAEGNQSGGFVLKIGGGQRRTDSLTVNAGSNVEINDPGTDENIYIGVPNATPTRRGAVMLAGDLAGTADLPQIAPGAVGDAEIGGVIGQSHLPTNTVYSSLSSADSGKLVASSPTGSYYVDQDQPSRKIKWWEEWLANLATTNITTTNAVLIANLGDNAWFSNSLGTGGAGTNRAFLTMGNPLTEDSGRVGIIGFRADTTTLNPARPNGVEGAWISQYGVGLIQPIRAIQPGMSVRIGYKYSTSAAAAPQLDSVIACMGIVSSTSNPAAVPLNENSTKPGVWIQIGKLHPTQGFKLDSIYAVTCNGSSKSTIAIDTFYAKTWYGFQFDVVSSSSIVFRVQSARDGFASERVYNMTTTLPASTTNAYPFIGTWAYDNANGNTSTPDGATGINNKTSYFDYFYIEKTGIRR